MNSVALALIQLVSAVLGIVAAGLNLRSAIKHRNAKRTFRLIAAACAFYIAVIMLAALFDVIDFMPEGGMYLWPGLLALLGILAGYAILDS
jgi:L-asparagine transporter-like permease